MSEIRAPDERVKVKKDLRGMKFGRLTVVDQADDYVGNNGKHYAKWLCQCECGNRLSVRQDALKRGGVISCGCWQRELTSINKKGVPVTHGGTYDRLYGIWVNMRRRYRAQNRRDSKSYSARGIKVCDAWEKDYQSFKDWALLNGYEAEAEFGACTLDRIDVNGPYSLRIADGFLCQNRQTTKQHPDFAHIKGKLRQSLSGLMNTGSVEKHCGAE